MGIVLAVAAGYIPARLAIAQWQAPKPQAILTLGGRPAREAFTADFARLHPELKIWVSSGLRPNDAHALFRKQNIPDDRVNLAACLAAMGRKILLIDLDPQGNATSSLGLADTEEKSCYGPLLGESKLADNIVVTRFDNLSIVPADLDLAGVEIEVARLEDHLVRLRTAIAPMRKKSPFDYIFLDCPPSLGILMTNALAAADVVLVPLQAEFFALEGLTRIMEVAEKLQSVNPKLLVEGIVMTMVDTRTNLNQQVIAEVKTHFPKLIYDTVIPRSVRLGEAPSFGKPILEYSPASLGAFAYTALAGEFLRRDSKIAEKSTNTV